MKILRGILRWVLSFLWRCVMYGTTQQLLEEFAASHTSTTRPIKGGHLKNQDTINADMKERKQCLKAQLSPASARKLRGRDSNRTEEGFSSLVPKQTGGTGKKEEEKQGYTQDENNFEDILGKMPEPKETTDESDAHSSDQDNPAMDKQKRKLSKKQRQQLQLSHTLRRKAEFALYKLHFGQRRIQRVGPLSSPRYFRNFTQTVQRHTKYQEKFFCYEAQNFRSWIIDNLHRVDMRGKVFENELLMANIVHLYSWPIPFPMMKYADISQYADKLTVTVRQLQQVSQLLEKLPYKNKEFMQIRLKSLFAFAALGEGEFGKASSYLEEGSHLAQGLEPCEWTGWLYLAYAFLNICWGARSTKYDMYDRGLDYLEVARLHFLEDSQKGGSYNIAMALILWWMFLIKSRAIRCSWKDSRCLEEICQHKRFVGCSGEDRKNAYQLLKMFQIEVGNVTDFPKDNLYETIIKKFEQQTSAEKPDIPRHRKRRDSETHDKDRASQVQQTTALESSDDNAPMPEVYAGVQDIHSLYEKLTNDINGKIPEEVQTMYVFRKDTVHRIVFNINKGSKHKISQFLQEHSRSVFMTGLLLLEQTSCPELCMPNKSVPSFDPKGGHRLRIGMDVTSCSVEDLLEGTYFPGVVGGFLFDRTTGMYYGSGAEHVLNVSNSNNSESPVFAECINKTDETKRKYYSVSEKKIQCCRSTDDDGHVDFGIFEMDKQSIHHPGREIFVLNDNRKPVHLKTFHGLSSNMKQKQVRKLGRDLSTCPGEIVVSEVDRTFMGRKLSGHFFVAPVSKASFAIKGHSGAWVADDIKDKTEANVYGVLHAKQPLELPYVDQGVLKCREVNVAICLRFDKQIEALNRKFNLNLAIYNHDSDIEICQNKQRMSTFSNKTDDSGYSTKADFASSKSEKESETERLHPENASQSEINTESWQLPSHPVKPGTSDTEDDKSDLAASEPIVSAAESESESFSEHGRVFESDSAVQ